MTPCVVFQASQPYSSTDLTFELKSLIFVEIEILDAFHTLLRLAKAVLAFPILVLQGCKSFRFSLISDFFIKSNFKGVNLKTTF